MRGTQDTISPANIVFLVEGKGEGGSVSHPLAFQRPVLRRLRTARCSPPPAKAVKGR